MLVDPSLVVRGRIYAARYGRPPGPPGLCTSMSARAALRPTTRPQAPWPAVDDASVRRRRRASWPAMGLSGRGDRVEGPEDELVRPRVDAAPLDVGGHQDVHGGRQAQRRDGRLHLEDLEDGRPCRRVVRSVRSELDVRRGGLSATGRGGIWNVARFAVLRYGKVGLMSALLGRSVV